MTQSKLFTALLFSITFISYSQNNFNNYLMVPQPVIENLKSATGADAIAITITSINNGKKQTMKYRKHRNEMLPPNDAMLFEIGSVTKTFTGLLIAKAVTEGRVTLNDDVRKYLDGDYPNLEFNGKPITIKDLLVFKTGVNRDFPDYGTLMQKMNDSTAIKFKALEDAYSKGQFFADLKTAKVEIEPGTVYAHTKLGPELCAVVLEKVYNKSYEQLMNDLLYNIGMENSGLHLKDDTKAIIGQNENGIVMPAITDGLWGAAGMLKATPEDIAQYMLYQMDPKNPIATESHRILSEGNDGVFAYCWNIIKDHEGKTGYWMHGGTFGLQNLIYIYPEYNLGISVMVNRSGPDTYPALNEARRALENYLKPGKKSIIREVRSVYSKKAKKAVKYYYKLKKTNNFYLDENEINSYGYSFLWDKKPEAALEIFNLYVQEFPQSANGYDSRGEVYYALKNYTASRKDYEKSLQLNPQNDNAKQMLEKLKGL